MAEKETKVEAKEKKEVEVPQEFKDIVEKIEKMSVLELSKLVKVLEEKFDVSAAMPVMAAAMPAQAGGAEAKEEKTNFNVELTEVGASKINVIKVVREVTGKGLKDSKDLVDKTPSVIKENVPKKDAEEIKKKLETAGAKAELK
jgi:large subunit ribosomal protein L7/L12